MTVLLQILAGIMVAFFGVVGAVSIIKWAVLKITAPSNSTARLYGVMLKGENADIELQMAIETLRWDSELNSTRAYAIDCGIDSLCYLACEKMCRNGRFRLVTVEEFADILNNNNL